MTPEEVRRLADEILERSEFDEPEPNLLERISTWVGDRVQDVVDAVSGGGVFTVLAVLVVLAGLWFLGRWLWRRDRSRRRRHPVEGVWLDEVRRRTPAEWRAEAEELEARGEWKLALRARYRALVGELLAAGVVDDAAGRTTGELRAEVATAAPEKAAAFAAASDLFDLAWYAGRPTGPEENVRFRDLAADVAGVRA